MPRNYPKGFASFYLVIILVTVITGSALSIFVLSQIKTDISRNAVWSSQAYFIAEAGLEDVAFRILKGKKYEATYNLSLGKGQASLAITDEGNLKKITSRGQVSLVNRSVELKLEVSQDTVSFHYGAQVDKGGLKMSNNAKVIGNVYSNGSVLGSSLSSQITGDLWVAGSLAVQPDQQWTVKNADFEFGLKKNNIYYLDVAQSFIPSVSKVLNIASFYLKKIGSPPDQTVRVLTNSGFNPTKTVLGTGTLKSSKVTGNYSWVDVSFSSPPSLTAGQTYWLMIDTSRDDNDYWVWGKDLTDGYPSGTAKYSHDWTESSPVWDGVGGDLDFKTMMGGETPTVIDKILVGVDAHANTIANAAVGRDAYYQTIDQNTTVAGTKYPDSSDPPTKDLSISLAQIQDQEVAAQLGGVIEGNYLAPAGSQLGPIKINGDLSFPDNNYDNPVIITGPVWVTGKISASGNAKIKLKAGLTFSYPIIADNPGDRQNQGKIVFTNNVVTEDSSQGGYLIFISTNQSLSDDNPAVLVSNNINKDKPSSILFSLYGLIKVENNVKFKEITGYGLQLENNTEIVYEQGLVNASFSSGPGASWKIISWREVQ
jgi:hypothetical protein